MREFEVLAYKLSSILAEITSRIEELHNGKDITISNERAWSIIHRMQEIIDWSFVKAKTPEQKDAERRSHLTTFGVGTLAFLAGFGVCWFVFVH